MSRFCQWCGAPCTDNDQARLFEPGPSPRSRITRPEDLAALVMPALAERDREHCVVVVMDSKHQVRALRQVSVGTICQTFMEPREVYRDALLAGAATIAVAHNHPSGDPAPSDEDRAVTRRLKKAGDVLGVTLLDHLVVGGPGTWRSMGRMGLL